MRTKAARAALAVLTLAVWALAAYAGDGTDPSSKDSADVRAVVEGSQAFALDLYGKLRAAEKGNLCFSPHAISTALAMTYGGARGKTAEQMAKALHFTLEPSRLRRAVGALAAGLNEGDPKKRGFELAVADRLWCRQGFPFLDDFLATTKSDHGSGLETVDFAADAEAARKTINDWVDERTNKKIQDLLPLGSVDRATQLVLANAVHFKGNWAIGFDKAKTQVSPFDAADGSTVMVPLMFFEGEGKASGFRHGDSRDVEALELPYLGGRLSMLVLLPRMGALADVEAQLTPVNLARWTRDLEPVGRIAIMLPRFQLAAQLSLKEALKACGMEDAFDAGAADFSGMTGTKGPVLSAVAHKALVEVSEEGGEAAPATAERATSPGCTMFFAVHPFIFMIRDVKTGSILFIGRLVHPDGPAPGSLRVSATTNGEPIANESISLAMRSFWRGDARFGDWGDNVFSHCKTDDQGCFTLVPAHCAVSHPDSDETTYEFVLESKDGAGVGASVRGLRVPSGSETKIAVDLKPGTRIEGKLTATAEVNVNAVRFLAAPAEVAPGQFARSRTEFSPRDKDGKQLGTYCVDIFGGDPGVGGKYTIAASAWGHATVLADVTPGRGRTTGPDLEIGRGKTITVTLVNREGEPQRDKAVFLDRDAGLRDAMVIDPESRFVLRGVPPGTYTVSIEQSPGRYVKVSDAVVGDADVDLGKVGLP